MTATLSHRTLRRLGATAIVLAVLLVGSLALPIRAWRTGEPPAAPLPLAPAPPLGPRPLRIWIDTDAACGHGDRTDSDDCLAILLLARSGAVEIVGISTVFGNAPRAVTDSTTRALVAAIGAEPTVPVHRGAAAVAALRRALEAEPLVIVALGPLTNVAAALRDRPGLRPRVARLVAVMGRRRGHLFHPVEGGTARTLLGHGPVFRDFNFSQDPAAATELLGQELPWTLVPYEAARQIVWTGAELEAMRAAGGAAAWVAKRSEGWLRYWRDDIGKAGFYPFDLIAAAYAIDPALLRCAEVIAWSGRDAGLLGLLSRRGLFAARDSVPHDAVAAAPALYCPAIDARLKGWLRSQLLAD